MIEILIALTILLFVFLNLIIILSLNKILHSKSLTFTNNSFHPFSIIVSMKNEQKNVSNLINSFYKLQYPNNKYEILLIDDNSTDDTINVAKREITKLEDASIHIAASKIIPGKKGALSFGINKSKNNYVIITDADCRPQVNWLVKINLMFQRNYDFIFGHAPFVQTKNLINKISCFENLRSSILTFGFAQLKLPYSAASRNFAFNKNKFYEIKGYQNTTDVISGDDDLLIREAYKNKLKIGVFVSKDSFVFSETKKSLKDYIQQKARHTQTSFHYLFKVKTILAFWHLVNLFFLFSPLLYFLDPMFLLLFLSKIIIDLITVSIFQDKFGYRFNFFEKIYLQIFYEVFLIINFFSAKFLKIQWK